MSHNRRPERSRAKSSAGCQEPLGKVNGPLQAGRPRWFSGERVLEYPKIELSNNPAENSMRPVALGEVTVSRSPRDAAEYRAHVGVAVILLK